jgi:Arc/MetJ family transcription regulator
VCSARFETTDELHSRHRIQPAPGQTQPDTTAQIRPTKQTGASADGTAKRTHAIRDGLIYFSAAFLDSFRLYVYKQTRIIHIEADMRTNIEIDDDLISEAMRATGQNTKRGTVEEALRRVVATHRKLQAIDDMAGLGWEGDLNEMRTGRSS